MLSTGSRLDCPFAFAFYHKSMMARHSCKEPKGDRNASAVKTCQLNASWRAQQVQLPNTASDPDEHFQLIYQLCMTSHVLHRACVAHSAAPGSGPRGTPSFEAAEQHRTF